MNLSSEKIVISTSDRDVFEQLTDFSYFKELLPPNLQKFETTEDTIVFQLQGMPEIGLRLKEATPYTNIVFEASGGKIPFILEATIHSLGEQQTEIQWHFSGNFSPMLTLMVKKPITKFIEALTEKSRAL